jgi:hypothetical protein
MSLSNDFSYKAKVRGRAIWSRYPRARFAISVGQPYHESEKLRAAIYWASTEGRFEGVDILVGDAPQRYNMPGEPEQNLVKSIAAGDAWIARNETILSTAKNLFLYRWDDIRSNPNFDSHLKMVDQKIKDQVFFDAMRRDIDAYIQRTGKDFKTCMAFLREELAVFNLAQELRPATDVYPGTFLECRRLLRPDFAMVRVQFRRTESHDMMAA